MSAFMFDSSVGGVENHIRFMVREFKRMGHEVVLFKPTFSGGSDSVIYEEGLEIRIIKIGDSAYKKLEKYIGFWPYFTGFIRKVEYIRGSSLVAHEIAKYAPDFVWQHDFMSSLFATKKLRNQFKIVLTNHTGEFLLLKKLHILFPLVSKWLLSHYALIIGPSKELTPRYCACKAVTIHNGVDINLFKHLSIQERADLREKIVDAKYKDKIIVLCPRRWSPTKGIKYFAMAGSALGAVAEKFVFVFAGNDYDGYPGYVQEVHQELKKMEVDYILLGNISVSDMTVWCSIADIVVIPSLYEAVSLSALEAMASGTVVIATNVGGMPELIADSKNGFLIPPKDPVSLAEKIKKVGLDADLRKRVGAAAYVHVLDTYNWPAIAQRTLNAIEEVVYS